ncbi:MAG: hypothetical protein ACRDH1_09410 [Actinomycetota bacterium]
MTTTTESGGPARRAVLSAILPGLLAGLSWLFTVIAGVVFALNGRSVSPGQVIGFAVVTGLVVGLLALVAAVPCAVLGGRFGRSYLAALTTHAVGAGAAVVLAVTASSLELPVFAAFVVVGAGGALWWAGGARPGPLAIAGLLLVAVSFGMDALINAVEDRFDPTIAVLFGFGLLAWVVLTWVAARAGRSEPVRS